MRIGAGGKHGGINVEQAPNGKQIATKRIPRYAPSLTNLMQRLSAIDHPNLAKINNVYIDQSGCLCLERNFINGIDLKTIFTTPELYRKVDEMQFIQAGCAVLRALNAMHNAGVIHRDIKPSNIIIPFPNTTQLPTPDSPAQLPTTNHQLLTQLDFSQAILIDFSQASAWPYNGDVRTSFSLVYSPPEMLLKKSSLVCPASDLFALSITLFQLINGRAPYTDCNPEILVNLQLTYPMKQPTRMTDQLFAVLAKAAYKASFRLPPRRLGPEETEQTLQRGIQGRYQSANEMLADLQQVTAAIKPSFWQKILKK